MNASDWLRKRLRQPSGCLWLPAGLALLALGAWLAA